MIAMFEVMSVNEVMAAAPDVVVETQRRAEKLELLQSCPEIVLCWILDLVQAY